jgi:hypothetical protein
LYQVKKLALILSVLVMGLSVQAGINPVPNATVLPTFTVFPNPVSGNTFAINLTFTQSQFPNAQITLSNVLGQVVYRHAIKQEDYDNGAVRVDVSDARLEKGVYFVQIKSGETSKTVKLAIR